MRYEGGQYYVKSEEEMRALFPYAQEAIDNTAKIAARCNVEIEFQNYKLPHYDVPEGYTSKSYLIKLCEDGLTNRYEEITPEHRDRLNYELGVIENMGFVDYFLIVWDYINFCRQNDIPVGPGRGSAAGSLVSYCLKITDIDPIRYDLLFERFLNPSRRSMPDIDVDFSDEKRDQVINYVSEKYGKDHVVQIGSFGKMLAKGVIRDVARVMDFPYSEASKIAKLVPNQLGITLDEALDLNPEFKELYNTDEQIHHLIDMCRKLEGLPRNTSTHAAGVVICPDAADNYVPLFSRGGEEVLTQFEKETVEHLGLLKMDFLGLRTLSLIRNAVDMVKENHGVDVDIEAIDLSEKKSLELIGTGNTDGVFQLESAGMKSFMKELKPKSFEDIIAGISLYRPGPMSFIPKYIEGKEHPENVTYACPELEPILSATYGCIVYQEQVMQIVRTLAGYSMADADAIRKAMSKKNQDYIDEGRQSFVEGDAEKNIEGSVHRGIDAGVANRIYDSMVDFGQYAFNKSHAACYAVVAMRTAYLKAHYPVEFMAALLTSVIGTPTKIARYIMSCREMGIKILPPDVNVGDIGFTAEDGNIRYPMVAIKSIGYPITRRIIDERNRRGPFKDIRDFILRVGDSGAEVGKRVIENLIKAGAMDCFGANRHQLMCSYDQIVDSVHKERKKTMAGQMNLFDMMSDAGGPKLEFQFKLADCAEYPKEELLALEKEVLGIYLSGHPIEEYKDLWKKKITHTTEDFKTSEVGLENEDQDMNTQMLVQRPDENEDPNRLRGGEEVTVGGIISEIKTKFTKRDDIMAFVSLEDMFGTVEVIVFPRAYEKNRPKLEEGRRVFISGRVTDDDENDLKVICDKVIEFDEIPGQIWIQFENEEMMNREDPKIREMLDVYDGKSMLIYYVKDIKKIIKNPTSVGVQICRELLDKLSGMYGEDNVKVTYA
jgi:DNA polymerase-3 subunit alpha